MAEHDHTKYLEDAPAEPALHYPEESTGVLPVVDSPVVAAPEEPEDLDDDLDDDLDAGLLDSVMAMAQRRKRHHRRRLKQMRLFEELWTAAHWCRKMLGQR